MEKSSYEHRVYESVYGRYEHISWDISQLSTENRIHATKG